MLVSAFSRVLPFLFIGLLVWPFTASATTLDDIVEEFPIVGATIDAAVVGGDPRASSTSTVTGAVAADAEGADVQSGGTDVWGLPVVPASVLTPGASGRWLEYRWADGTHVRIALRQRVVGAAVEALEVGDSATLLSGIAPGIDHAVYAANDRFVEEFLFLDSDHPSNAGARSLVWDVVGMPSSWRMLEPDGGTIQLFDTVSDEIRLTITAPVVEDETGRDFWATLAVQPGSDSFSLSMDLGGATGVVMADPLFSYFEVGYVSQTFCRNGLGACSVGSSSPTPNWSHDGSTNYSLATSTGHGIGVSATGSSICSGCFGRFIYTPAGGLNLHSLNVFDATVRTGGSKFGCNVQAEQGATGNWLSEADGFATYSGSMLNMQYTRQMIYYNYGTHAYFNRAAITMKNVSAGSQSGGSGDHRCTLEDSGLAKVILQDPMVPQQDTAPYPGPDGATFDPAEWYGPNRNSATILADVSDGGTGVYYLRPKFRNASNGAALYPGGVQHSEIMFCNGVGVGPNDEAVRPCRIQPAPTAIAVTFPGSLTNGTNDFWWEIRDFSTRITQASMVDLKWDETRPTSPTVVADGTGLDIDATAEGATLKANWGLGSDTVSGMHHFLYCWSTNVNKTAGVATSCGGTIKEIGTTWTRSATASAFTAATGVTYYFCVQSFDKAGNYATTATCSDGITPVAAPNAPSSLIDGPGGSDVAAIADDGGVSAAFTAASPTSVGNVQGCVVVLAQSASNCASGAVVTWQNVELDSDYASVAFAANMTAGQSYRTCIRFQGFNGIYGAAACTNGFVVDTANPFGAAGVHDGAGATDVDRIAPNAAIAIGFNAPVDQGGSVVTDAIVCWYPAGDTDQCDSSEAVEQQSAAGPGSTSVTLENPAALVRGRTYIACVSFMDAAQNEGARGCSNGFAITGASLQSAWSETGQVQASTSTLQGHFAYVDGPAVDMVEQCVTTGTTPAACTSWTPTGLEGAFEVDGLTLTDSAAYRYCYRLLNESDTVLESGCSPDPVTIDATAPTAVTAVQDGDVPGTDSNLSIASTTVGATWTAATDAGGSGIAGYETCVVDSTATCGTDDWTENPQPGTSATSFVEDVYGDVMKVCVRAVDYAGNASVSACSNGQVVDASDAEIAHHAQQRELVGLPTSEAAVEAALADPDSVQGFGTVASPSAMQALRDAYGEIAQIQEVLGASGFADQVVDLRGQAGSSPTVSAYVVGSTSGIENDVEQGMSSSQKSRFQVKSAMSSVELSGALELLDEMRVAWADEGVRVLGTSIDGEAGRLVVDIDTDLPKGDPVLIDGVGLDEFTGGALVDNHIEVRRVTEGDDAGVMNSQRFKAAAIKEYRHLVGGASISLVGEEGSRNYGRCTSNGSFVQRVPGPNNDVAYAITASHCYRRAVNRDGNGAYVYGGSQLYRKYPSLKPSPNRWRLSNEVRPFALSNMYDMALMRIRNTGIAGSDVFTRSVMLAPPLPGQPAIWDHWKRDISVVRRPVVGHPLCHSGVNSQVILMSGSGEVCGEVRPPVWKKLEYRYANGNTGVLNIRGYVVNMPACTGDSGGAVYTPAGGALVGLVSGGGASEEFGVDLPSSLRERMVSMDLPARYVANDVSPPKDSTLCPVREFKSGNNWYYDKVAGVTLVPAISDELRRIQGDNEGSRFSLGVL